MSGYAVVDVETTGLSPGYHHRVVEVAVVHMALDGSITAQWSTLLNPKRDLGPTHIHGIRAAEVRRAPAFEDIAGTLRRLLAGRVPVAHNLSFDARFLAAEYALMGVQAPLVPAHGLCTMRLAGTYLPQAGTRSLEGCCAAAGVDQMAHHTALADARAAAGLLGRYLATTPSPRWDDVVARCAALDWPPVPEHDITPVPRAETAQPQEHFLARLVQRLPAESGHEDLEPYLAVLDRALIDRHLSATEAEELLDTATRLGLGREEVMAAHRRYLLAVAHAAWEDAVVTDTEHADLREVTSLLGLEESDLRTALDTAKKADRATPRKPAGRATALTLSSGDLVVFTGTSERTREEWHALAHAAGLDPKPAVTKKTRVVVAADPDSESSKARKARQYGIPIITEHAFDRLLRAMS